MRRHRQHRPDVPCGGWLLLCFLVSVISIAALFTLSNGSRWWWWWWGLACRYLLQYLFVSHTVKQQRQTHYRDAHINKDPSCLMLQQPPNSQCHNSS